MVAVAPIVGLDIVQECISKELGEEWQWGPVSVSSVSISYSSNRVIDIQPTSSICPMVADGHR